MSKPPLMLSVSGLRGLIGQSLTPSIAARYAAAFGQWLKNNTAQPHVVLGRDSRPSGQMIEMAAAAGLVAVGCRVTHLGIVTTPGVAIMTEHLQADGGMVITASHNPIAWNGIKALRADGVAPPSEQAQEIIEQFKTDAVDYAPVENLAATQNNTETHKIHIDRVLDHINVQAIRQKKLKVVLDSVHGAGGPVTSMLFEQLGVEVVHLYAEPTGLFPHQPEPTRENLTQLCDVVREHRADIGFAQDPDADRLAVVDNQGQYIGEEYTLALTCLHMLGRIDHPSDSILVTNLSTSRMIDDISAKVGAKVIRTPVGEAHVAAAIRAHHAIIGGEGNGGVIWPKVIHVRDSIVGIALLLEMLALRDDSLSEIVAQTPHYAIVKDKANIQPNMTRQCVQAMQNHFATEKIDLQDGVRVDWPDRWVHVRPSNTEPILRIIAEANNENVAKQLIHETRQALGIA